jgi:hypothetical protein
MDTLEEDACAVVTAPAFHSGMSERHPPERPG